jgi:3-methyladenine DNA glycosylase AlkD
MNSQKVVTMLQERFDKRMVFTSTNNRKSYLGISYPNLKTIASEIFKENYIEFLETNDTQIYELEILQTILIGKIKNIDQAIKYFNIFAPFAKEWSVVDSLCQRFIIAKRHDKEVYQMLIEYAKQDDEYLQRIVAVMLLSHYNNDQYIDDSLELLGTLKHQGYYTKMAVAWAVATLMVRYPQKCIDFLKQQRLDPWTHNKSIQKILESFRITQQNKDVAKQLKY